jgi:hypothetical protein
MNGQSFVAFLIRHIDLFNRAGVPLFASPLLSTLLSAALSSGLKGVV